MKNNRVAVALSGGVDSATVAYLLKKSGHDVVGITLNIWHNDDETFLFNGREYGETLIRDARNTALNLGIEHHVVNCGTLFETSVIKPFLSEYLDGKTPNPCVICNPLIKFSILLEKATDLGADFLATGHYSSITKLPNGRYSFKAFHNNPKDQTYVLYGLSQQQASKILTPLGGMDKGSVRKMAKEAGISISEKPDSQEICFIPDNNHERFIETHCKPSPGDFIDMEGKTVGKHRGLPYYTIGQRKGLIWYGRPIYVRHIDKETNKIQLADNKDLFGKNLIADKINFMSEEKIENTVEAVAKIRYKHKPAECYVKVRDNLLHIEFKEPQRAITPGQAVVVYMKDLILCGATIKKANY